jgi:hypothetical protein
VKRLWAVGIAGLALAGCSSGGGVPYPNGPWSAGDQGTFMGSCDTDASDSYCKCALGDVMQQYADTSSLPGSILAGGTAAANHKGDFPECAGK